MNATPTDGGDSKLTELAAAATAVIGVFAGLAVTGVIGQTQRNHGLQFVVALVLVLLGGFLWLLVRLVQEKDDADHKYWNKFVRFFHEWGPSIALFVFVVGMVVGIVAIWQTQNEAERPSVSSTYDPATRMFSLTATAHGLRTDSRLVIVVSGFTGTPDRPVPEKDPPTLYYAVVGPNGDGDVEHTATVPVPPNDTLVGVKAWTGKEPTACTAFSEEAVVTETPQHDRAGCLLLQVGAKA